jgi:hypothetical protein
MTDRQDRPPKAALPRLRLFANERTGDKMLLWRVGAWGGLAVVTLIIAIVVARSPVAARHDALTNANAVITIQAKQLQQAIRQGDLETRRLSAALETLNADRDRLFTRVTALERELESVTGSIKKLATAPTPAASPSPAPVVAAPQSVPVAAKPAPVPPEPFPPPHDMIVAAVPPGPEPAKPEVTASIAPKPAAASAEKQTLEKLPVIVQPTEAEKAKAAANAVAKQQQLGIDLGSASSIDGLRAIWASTRTAHPAAVEGLQPIITLQEPKNGLGLQLRLVAGPLPDAASVASRCASLIEATRPCTSAAYDGQKLPASAAHASARATPPRRTKSPRSEPKVAAPPKSQRSVSFPNIFGSGGE